MMNYQRNLNTITCTRGERNKNKAGGYYILIHVEVFSYFLLHLLCLKDLLLCRIGLEHSALKKRHAPSVTFCPFLEVISLSRKTSIHHFHRKQTVFTQDIFVPASVALVEGIDTPCIF